MSLFCAFAIFIYCLTGENRQQFVTVLRGRSLSNLYCYYISFGNLLMAVKNGHINWGETTAIMQNHDNGESLLSLECMNKIRDWTIEISAQDQTVINIWNLTCKFWRVSHCGTGWRLCLGIFSQYSCSFPSLLHSLSRHRSLLQISTGCMQKECGGFSSKTVRSGNSSTGLCPVGFWRYLFSVWTTIC